LCLEKPKLDDYIKLVSEKLADEQLRSEVTKIERLVITGANITQEHPLK